MSFKETTSKTSSPVAELAVAEPLVASPDPEAYVPREAVWSTPVNVMTPTVAAFEPLSVTTTLWVPVFGATSFQISTLAPFAGFAVEPTLLSETPSYVTEETVRVEGFAIETPTSIRRWDPDVVCEIVMLEPVPVPVLVASTAGAAHAGAMPTHSVQASTIPTHRWRACSNQSTAATAKRRHGDEAVPRRPMRPAVHVHMRLPKERRPKTRRSS